MAFKFEKLDVWQRAVDLTYQVHELTEKFPQSEQYILTSQFKRAADSIALNIAEGSTGQTNAEFRLFLGYALRSAMEVVTCLHIGKRRKLISDKDFTELYEKTESISRMIQALRKSIR